MPKSGFHVYKDTDSEAVSVHLPVYYCLCGQIVLIMTNSVESAPKRVTDEASIVKCEDIQKNLFKEGGMKILKRKEGAERQYRLHCPHCNLWCAYYGNPFKISQSFLYIVSGSLTTDALSNVAKQADGEVNLLVAKKLTPEERFREFKLELIALLRSLNRSTPSILASELGSEYFRIYRKPLYPKELNFNSYQDLLEECRDIVDLFHVLQKDGSKDYIVAEKIAEEKETNLGTKVEKK